MSYYYTYYIGYRKDGKIYPLGPYNSFGKLCSVVCRSRSYASEIHRYFSPINESEASDELLKEFSFKDYKGEDCFEVKSYPLDCLPDGSHIKKGYFLISDVKAYEESEDALDLFYECLSSDVYAAMVRNELTFGRPEPEKDCEGNEYDSYSASDYMYYAYEDRYCEEYESYLLRQAAEMLSDNSSFPDGAEIVVLETEG